MAKYICKKTFEVTTLPEKTVDTIEKGSVWQSLEYYINTNAHFMTDKKGAYIYISDHEFKKYFAIPKVF